MARKSYKMPESQNTNRVAKMAKRTQNILKYCDSFKTTRGVKIPQTPQSEKVQSLYH